MNRLHLRGDKRSEVPFACGERIVGYNGEIYGALDPKLVFVENKGGGVEELDFLHKASQNLSIDGMFAYAEYDNRNDELILARDRFGIKPLFYRPGQSYTLFSSCVRSFFKPSEAEKPAPNLAALFDVYTYGYSLTTNTVYQGISELLPGTELRLGADANCRISKVNSPQFSVEKDQQAQLRRALRQSVKSCAQGDYTIGLAISGGIDSTILAHELNELGIAGVETFSVYIPETGDGIRVLSELGLPENGIWTQWKHNCVEITPKNFKDHLLESLNQFYYPTDMHSIPLYATLAKMVEKRGIRVLLTGEGADEYFMGYERYVHYAGKEQIENYYLEGLKGSFIRRIFDAQTITEGIARGDAFSSGEFWSKIRQLEIKARLQKLLLRTDVILMEHQIEGRTPFLHGGMPEIALQTRPEDLRGQRGKEALRKAFATSIQDIEIKEKKRFKAPDRLFWEVFNDPEILNLIYSPAEIPGMTLSDSLIREIYDCYPQAPGEMSELLYLVLTTKHAFLKKYGTI
jgi:asparagine synthase (glutamine-hydrolysing)